MGGGEQLRVLAAGLYAAINARPIPPAAVVFPYHQHFNKAVAEEMVVQHAISHRYSLQFGNITDRPGTPDADLRRTFGWLWATMSIVIRDIASFSVVRRTRIFSLPLFN